MSTAPYTLSEITLADLQRVRDCIDVTGHALIDGTLNNEECRRLSSNLSVASDVFGVLIAQIEASYCR